MPRRLGSGEYARLAKLSDGDEDGLRQPAFDESADETLARLLVRRLPFGTLVGILLCHSVRVCSWRLCMLYARGLRAFLRQHRSSTEAGDLVVRNVVQGLDTGHFVDERLQGDQIGKTLCLELVGE
jgi:hypothetical protein